MTAISLVAGNCRRGRGSDDLGFEHGSDIYFDKDLFAGGLFKSYHRKTNGVWLKAFEGSRIRNRFRVIARVRKGKKHDYPWPEKMDPNIDSGHLAYLSYFKPLTEKPKLVTLAFEKPLVDLEKKINEVRKMADETGLDFSTQISSLENKYRQALKDLYTHLTPIQRLTIARHPNRPTVLDHIINITEKWVELHGDRAGYDDPAIVTGIGSIDGKSYMFIGHQKGRNTKENIARNFAMPTPHGPEACAAILWKSSQAAPKAAEKLRITAQEHYKLKIADGIIPEPLGGAHADPIWASQQIKLAIIQAMEELSKMNTEELLHHRLLKFRSIGGFQEGIPADPERKRNMKQDDINTQMTDDIESGLESLKKKILKAKGQSDPNTSQVIEKLKQDVDQEISNAFISMGLEEKLKSLKLELSKAQDRPPKDPLNRALKERVDELMQEFKQNLSQPGAYLGLKLKLEKLNMVGQLTELKAKREKLKMKINQKVPEEVKAKMEVLKNAQEKISKGDPFDKNMVGEVESAKNELKEVLKTANLEILGIAKRKTATLPPDLEEKIAKVNTEITKEIERVINVSGLGSKVDDLKAEIVKGSSPEKIEKLGAEIKEGVVADLDVKALKEKVDILRAESSSPPQISAENGRR